MNKKNRGFSLVEITVVIFIMGITIAGLLQLFDLGHLRYNSIRNGLKSRALLTEIKVFLRNKIACNEIQNISTPNILKAVNFPDLYKLNKLKIDKYASDTYFINISIYEDRNSNKKVDKTENSFKRLFCFRRRSS
ncbi:MAG: type II secretion system protein [Candidatus Rifleibacteriota bacterium]